MRRRGRARAEGLHHFHVGRKDSIDAAMKEAIDHRHRTNDRREEKNARGIICIVISYHHHLFLNSPSGHDDHDDGDFLRRNRDAEENKMEGSAQVEVEIS